MLVYYSRRMPALYVKVSPLAVRVTKNGLAVRGLTHLEQVYSFFVDSTLVLSMHHSLTRYFVPGRVRSIAISVSVGLCVRSHVSTRAQQ